MHDSGARKPLIVFFHPYFRDGGVERTNIGLSKELIRVGYKVCFVTINPSDHYVDELKECGIEFVVLPARSTLSSQFSLVKWIRRRRSHEQSMVVISCQYYVNLLCLFFRPLWGKGIKHILSERNHFDEFKINQHGFKQYIVQWLVPIMYRFADTVIANSKELADDLRQITGRNVIPIYNPTINHRFSSMIDEEVSEDWFTGARRPIILTVGRMSLQKDHETLVKAFARLRERLDATLIIIGDGEQRTNLERLVDELDLSSSVIMPGFAPNPYKFMRSADLFVLSSVYEGLPNVLIEALAAGTNVISTACKSGPKEILNNGEYGQLVPVGDDIALSDAMEWALMNENEAAGKTAASRAYLDRFRPEVVASQLIDLF